MRLRSFVLALLGAAAMGLLPAAPVGAKEGVSATLTTRFPSNARPGTVVRVGWTLFSEENTQRRPFSADGIFVRLLSASGGPAEERFAGGGARAGEFAATVIVPEGGVGEIQIGLMGWSSGPNGTRRSDHLFPITNNPFLVPAHTEFGLVYTPGYGNSMVTRLDPLTLAPSQWRLRLGGNASSWSYSPWGNQLAVASFPQTLTVLDTARMRSLGRVRLAPGGGVVHAVTWVRRDRVVAVVETPRGALVVSVDPFARRVIGSTQLRRPFASFERLPNGLVFLLGARNRILPAQLGLVRADGHVTTISLPQVPIGSRVSGSGNFTQRLPGLAVNDSTGTAYLFSGDRLFRVNLRTRSVSDPGPLRTLAKVTVASYRSAQWLGAGGVAVSGSDHKAGTRTPHGLRIVDLRASTSRTIDAGASSFTVVRGLLLVENPIGRRALSMTAYDPDGNVRYRLEIPGATWMKKQGLLGYACRYDKLRAVVDLRDGTLLRQFAGETRCATVLADDSR